MHWAFERAAGLRDSFRGQLERGNDPDQDRTAMAAPAPSLAPAEVHATEMLVGMLQGAAARDVDPVAFVAFADEMLATVQSDPSHVQVSSMLLMLCRPPNSTSSRRAVSHHNACR